MSAETILSDLEQLGVRTTGLCADSRAVQPGDVFVALPGHRVDGRAFAADAVARGAAAVLYEDGDPLSLDVPAIAVHGLPQLIGEIANLVYRQPSQRLWMVGVTGTNGKTSVSQWIAQAMSLLGRKCAVVGTLGSGFPDQMTAGLNTTPDAIHLQRLLAEFVKQSAVACAMEVSSIGIDEGRVNGSRFDVAVFTNLTRDHLDYHNGMAAYGAAKERLFTWPGVQAAVINLDDPFGIELARRLAGRLRVIGYSLAADKGDRDLVARDLTISGAGVAFTIDGVDFKAPVIGRFNAANLLAVIGALLANGVPLTDIATVLDRISPPPGRMQAIGGGKWPLIVVDYAHTPDALAKALESLRETTAARDGKLICLFGCGGDRDSGKRPQMGAVAERLADRVMLTSDNPRYEDPQAIIDGILAGMKSRPAVEVNREAAIRKVLGEASPNDVVLLAGKGHETYQEIAGGRQAFSDLEHARRALELRP